MNIVACTAVARRYAVSSTPTADTAAGRSGSSIAGVPRSMIWRITVHHATPAQHHRPPADREITYPRRTSVLGPRNGAAGRAADQVGRGQHLQLQLAAGVGYREDLETGESEQGSTHRRRIVIHPGVSHARVRLAVITNREGPGGPTSAHLDGVGVSAPEPTSPRFDAKCRFWLRRRPARVEAEQP